MLPDFWFGVLAVLWAGFFVLEGFDFGVGAVLPLVARTGEERDVALRTIGPTWDGNEVWLLVAGGATFAAFPSWYATMFSGLYVPFALLLGGLIVRGIGIEYRGKVSTAAGRAWCEAGIVAGSLLAAVLFGVAFADLVRGLRLDAAHQVTGGLWPLLHPFGLLGGVVTLGFFSFHGSVFLALRTDGPVRARAHRVAGLLAPPLAAAAVAFLGWSVVTRSTPVADALAPALAALLLGAVAAERRRREGWSFALSAAVAAGLPVFVFASLWPDVVPSATRAAWALTVHGTAAGHYTLVVMTVVAVVMTPVVLAYQAWAYWVFRARVGGGGQPVDARLPKATVTADDAYRAR